MDISITGVLEDGRPRGAGVPADPRTTLTFPHGTDVTLTVKVVTSSGMPVDMSALGTQLLLSIKKTTWPYEIPALLHKDADLSQGRVGVGVFDIAHGDLWLARPGYYLYDVWLIRPDGELILRDAVVPASNLILTGSAADVPR